MAKGKQYQNNKWQKGSSHSPGRGFRSPTVSFSHRGDHSQEAPSDRAHKGLERLHILVKCSACGFRPCGQKNSID